MSSSARPFLWPLSHQLCFQEKAHSEHKGSTHWVVNRGASSRGLAINKKRGTQNRFGLWVFLQARKRETEMDTEMGNSPNQEGSQTDGRRDGTTFSEPIKGNRRQPSEG